MTPDSTADAGEGAAGALPLGEHSQIAPLGDAAAHGADDSCFRAKNFPNPVNLLLMAQMQRVILLLIPE